MPRNSNLLWSEHNDRGPKGLISPALLTAAAEAGSIAGRSFASDRGDGGDGSRDDREHEGMSENQRPTHHLTSQ
jgi:hypothetical protein